MLPLKKSITALNGSFLYNVSADLDAITVNTPSDGVFGRKNMLNLSTTDKLSDMIDKIVTHLEDITITQSLDNITLEIETYQARSSMTGNIVNVINSFRPGTKLTEPIYYDNGGVLSALVTFANNATISYDRELVNTSKKVDEISPDLPLDNIGSTDYLNIVSDTNTGDNKLYKIEVEVGGVASSIFNLTPGPSIFSYQLKHVNTSNITRLTNTVSFSIDNPLTPGINTTGISGITTVLSASALSGIPNAESLGVSFQAINCVRSYYNKDRVATIYGNLINDQNLNISFIPVAVPPPPHPQLGLPSFGGATNTDYVFNEIINILPGKFADGNNIGLSAKVYNSIGTEASSNLLVVGGKSVIINTTTTTESTNRVTSGVSLTPAVGTYGQVFNSVANLTATRELILYNNHYQYIEKDFSNYLLPGPDYSNLLPDPIVYQGTPQNVRWVTFKKTINQNFIRVNFTIETDFPSDLVSSNNVFIDNLIIMLTVENQTIWFDVNKSLIESDGCLDIVNSDKFNKVCICADNRNPVQGNIFVRIGIIRSSNVRIKNVVFN